MKRLQVVKVIGIGIAVALVLAGLHVVGAVYAPIYIPCGIVTWPFC